MENNKKNFGVRFKEAIGFMTETGTVGKMSLVIFVLLITSNIYYYFSVGKMFLTLLNTSIEKIYAAIANGTGLNGIISNADSVNLTISGYMSLFFSIFLTGIYVVLFLYCTRKPDGSLPKGSASYYLYVAFSILVTSILYMMLNMLISVFALPFIVAFWPIIIFSFCNRAEFGGTAGVALIRSFSMMGRSILKAILYGILISFIIFAPAVILTSISVLLLPHLTVKIGIILCLLSEAIYLITMARMYVVMYTENVAMPKPMEEEQQ
ncbi:MAG: hypothetical protein IKV30_03820 [Clostridia bacterium]|nr:hypothetical protein [Clostridia bacterium]